MSCVPNPYYGGGNQNDFDFDIYPYWDTVTGRPCTPGYNSPRIPQVTAIPGGGIQTNNDKLQIVLSSFLSGLALIRGAKQVPTTVSGEQTPTVIYQNAPGNGVGGSSTNLAGQAQSLIQRNPGATLIVGAIIVALFLKPPNKK